MELLIIRHGLPLRIENADGTAADPELADVGHAQANKLAGWLAGEHIDALYVSPLRRARQTAIPLAERTGLQPIVDDDVVEWDRDSAAYIPMEEMKAAKDGTWEAFLRGEISGPADPVAFNATVVGAFERIIGAHRGQTVAVVCHGGVINAYAGHVLGISASVGFFHPHYTSINRIVAASSGERSVASLNDVGHLRGTGLLG